MHLSGVDHRQGHDAAHAAAGLWNAAVEWTYRQWEEGKSPSQYETRAFLTSLPLEQRPLHAHTTEEVAYDLAGAITTYLHLLAHALI